MHGAPLGCELLDSDLDDSVASSRICRQPPLAALDLLAVASRAAARVACEQGSAVEAATRRLAAAAHGGGCVWIVGLGASEHRRRLLTKGYTALVLPEHERLPGRLGPRDVLLVAASGDAPSVLADAQRRRMDVIVLGGPGRLEHGSVDAYVRVPCYDERALELAHAFIVMALCAEPVGGGHAGAAARDATRSESGLAPA